MERLLLDADNRDRGVIVMGTGLSGRIAAEHDPLETIALRYSIVTPEPGRFDHVAVGWRRVLLVLSGKDPAADLALQFIDRLGAIALRLQQLTGRTVVDLILGNRIVGRFDGDGGQHELWLDQDTRKVVHMEPLHRDAHETLRRVIEPAEGGVAEPFDRRFPSYFGFRVIGFDRIIDDQDLAATAGQRAADR